MFTLRQVTSTGWVALAKLQFYSLLISLFMAGLSEKLLHLSFRIEVWAGVGYLAGILTFSLVVTASPKGKVNLGKYILSSRRKFAACTEPPKFAAYLMLMAFPRQHREATIGDLDEDFRTNVRKRFGQLGASVWYTWKALLYTALYLRETLRNKPYWRRLLSPVLRYFLAPLLVAHKLGWIGEAIGILRAHHLL
jgi:hypothetical protein